MNNKTKIGISVVALATAYAVGRFMAPESVRIETKIVEVEKKRERTDIDQKNNVKTIIVETNLPDGTIRKETTITDEGSTKISDRSDSVSIVDKEKTEQTTYSTSKVTVAVLAGANPFKLEQGVDIGGIVSKPVIGPLTVGIFGFKSGTVGLALGLTF